MNIAVQLQPHSGVPPEVKYTWDSDTDILSAQVRLRLAGDGISDSLEVEGSDGSWLVLDVAAGRINGVEVAVWPDVQKLTTLLPPQIFEDARVVVPERPSPPGRSVLDSEISMAAESDAAERMFHFRLGQPREARAVRVARDILLEVDSHSNIAGLWLLNVPPFPVDL